MTNLASQLEATMKELVAANALRDALATALSDLTSATDSLGEYGATVLCTSDSDAAIERLASKTIHEAWMAVHDAQQAVEDRMQALESQWVDLVDRIATEVAA